MEKNIKNVIEFYGKFFLFLIFYYIKFIFFFLGKFIFYYVSNGYSKYLKFKEYKENSKRYLLFFFYG